MKRWSMLGLLLVVACTAPAPRPDAHWRRTSDTAEPLDVARPACKAHAMARSSRVANEGMAAKAAAGAFAECMRERGWTLTDQD